MADVYVNATTGVDDEATNLGGGAELRGSENYPYATIDYAANAGRAPATVLTPGDTMYLMGSGGEFSAVNHILRDNDVQGTEGSPITVEPYDGTEVIINGALRLGFTSGSTLNYWTFNNLTLTNKGPSGYYQDCVEIGTAGGVGTDPDICTGIKITNCTIKENCGKQAGGVGGAIASSQGISILAAEDLEITGCTFENLRSRTVGQDNAGIAIGTHLVDAVISGNTFTDCSGDCIVFGNSNWDHNLAEMSDIIIEDNIFRVSDPYVYKDIYGTSYPTSPTYHQFNTDTYTFSDGGNTITRTSETDDLSVIEAGSCITVTNTSNNDTFYTVVSATSSVITTVETTVSESSVSAVLTTFDATYCGENAIDVKYGTNGIVIRDNTMSGWRQTATYQDCSGAIGSPFSISVHGGGVEFYRNTLTNNTQCFTCGAPSSDTTLHAQPPYLVVDAKIYSNIWKDTASPSTAIDLNSGDIRSLSVGNTKNLEIYNNIIDFSNNAAELMRTYSDSGSSVDTTTIIKNNVFISPTGTSAVTGAGTSEPTMDNNLWYSVASLDSQLSGPNDITSDPLLDAEHRPTENSPCIGAGTTPLSKFDYWGMPLTNNSYNIGAIWPAFVTSKKRRTL